MKSLRGLFVVGTDTAVGKTYVAAEIARSLGRSGRRVGVLKPVATGLVTSEGATRCEDGERLLEAIGGTVELNRVVPLAFEDPLAPPVAARRAGRLLTQTEVELATRRAIEWWADRAEVLVIEGVGGLLCPLAEGTTLADLAIALDYPLVIVARRGLGTLNHTLLTVEASRHRALRIAGVVLNGATPESGSLAEATNAEELARRLDGIAILADLPHQADLAMVPNCIGKLDWFQLARAPRWGGKLDAPSGRHAADESEC